MRIIKFIKNHPEILLAITFLSMASLIQFLEYLKPSYAGNEMLFVWGLAIISSLIALVGPSLIIWDLKRSLKKDK